MATEGFIQEPTSAKKKEGADEYLASNQIDPTVKTKIHEGTPDTSAKSAEPQTVTQDPEENNTMERSKSRICNDESFLGLADSLKPANGEEMKDDNKDHQEEDLGDKDKGVVDKTVKKESGQNDPVVKNLEIAEEGLVELQMHLIEAEMLNKETEATSVPTPEIPEKPVDVKQISSLEEQEKCGLQTQQIETVENGKEEELLIQNAAENSIPSITECQESQDQEDGMNENGKTERIYEESKAADKEDYTEKQIIEASINTDASSLQVEEKEAKCHEEIVKIPEKIEQDEASRQVGGEPEASSIKKQTELDEGPSDIPAGTVEQNPEKQAIVINVPNHQDTEEKVVTNETVDDKSEYTVSQVSEEETLSEEIVQANLPEGSEGDDQEKATEFLADSEQKIQLDKTNDETTQTNKATCEDNSKKPEISETMVDVKQITSSGEQKNCALQAQQIDTVENGKNEELLIDNTGENSIPSIAECQESKSQEDGMNENGNTKMMYEESKTTDKEGYIEKQIKEERTKTDASPAHVEEKAAESYEGGTNDAIVIKEEIVEISKKSEQDEASRQVGGEPEASSINNKDMELDEGSSDIPAETVEQSPVETVEQVNHKEVEEVEEPLEIEEMKTQAQNALLKPEKASNFEENQEESTAFIEDSEQGIQLNKTNDETTEKIEPAFEENPKLEDEKEIEKEQEDNESIIVILSDQMQEESGDGNDTEHIEEQVIEEYNVPERADKDDGRQEDSEAINTAETKRPEEEHPGDLEASDKERANADQIPLEDQSEIVSSEVGNTTTYGKVVETPDLAERMIRENSESCEQIQTPSAAVPFEVQEEALTTETQERISEESEVAKTESQEGSDTINMTEFLMDQNISREALGEEIQTPLSEVSLEIQAKEIPTEVKRREEGGGKEGEEVEDGTEQSPKVSEPKDIGAFETSKKDSADQTELQELQVLFAEESELRITSTAEKKEEKISLEEEKSHDSNASDEKIQKEQDREVEEPKDEFPAGTEGAHSNEPENINEQKKAAELREDETQVEPRYSTITELTETQANQNDLVQKSETREQSLSSELASDIEDKKTFEVDGKINEEEVENNEGPTALGLTESPTDPLLDKEAALDYTSEKQECPSDEHERAITTETKEKEPKELEISKEEQLESSDTTKITELLTDQILPQETAEKITFPSVDKVEETSTEAKKTQEEGTEEGEVVEASEIAKNIPLVEEELRNLVTSEKCQKSTDQTPSDEHGNAEKQKKEDLCVRDASPGQETVKISEGVMQYTDVSIKEEINDISEEKAQNGMYKQVSEELERSTSKSITDEQVISQSGFETVEKSTGEETSTRSVLEQQNDRTDELSEDPNVSKTAETPADQNLAEDKLEEQIPSQSLELPSEKNVLKTPTELMNIQEETEEKEEAESEQHDGTSSVHDSVNTAKPAVVPKLPEEKPDEQIQSLVPLSSSPKKQVPETQAEKIEKGTTEADLAELKTQDCPEEAEKEIDDAVSMIKQKITEEEIYTENTQDPEIESTEKVVEPLTHKEHHIGEPTNKSEESEIQENQNVEPIVETDEDAGVKTAKVACLEGKQNQEPESYQEAESSADQNPPPEEVCLLKKQTEETHIQEEKTLELETSIEEFSADQTLTEERINKQTHTESSELPSVEDNPNVQEESKKNAVPSVQTSLADKLPEQLQIVHSESPSQQRQERQGLKAGAEDTSADIKEEIKDEEKREEEITENSSASKETEEAFSQQREQYQANAPDNAKESKPAETSEVMDILENVYANEKLKEEKEVQERSDKVSIHEEARKVSNEEDIKTGTSPIVAREAPKEELSEDNEVVKAEKKVKDPLLLPVRMLETVEQDLKTEGISVNTTMKKEVEEEKAVSVKLEKHVPVEDDPKVKQENIVEISKKNEEVEESENVERPFPEAKAQEHSVDNKPTVEISTRNSLSDLLVKAKANISQGSDEYEKEKKETTVGKGGIDTGEAKTRDFEGTERADEEEAKTEEGGDEHKEDAVIVEPKDSNNKTPNKKSHNILSGVGSKVKNSISKVKKAITGKSSNPKPVSPK